MRLLALDIGTRKTGAAFGDTEAGFAVALDTIHHSAVEDLAQKVSVLADERKIQTLIIGLPRLLSGNMGAQAKYVQGVAKDLERMLKLPIIYADERYTSKGHKSTKNDDVKAACEILLSVLESQKTEH